MSNSRINVAPVLFASGAVLVSAVAAGVAVARGSLAPTIAVAAVACAHLVAVAALLRWGLVLGLRRRRRLAGVLAASERGERVAEAPGDRQDVLTTGALRLCDRLDATRQQLHRARRELRVSRERYRDLVDNLPVGIYRNELDSPGRFLMANPAVARIFGYAKVEELMQQPVEDVYVDPNDRRRLLQSLREQGQVALQVQMRRRDGSEFWAAVSARAIHDDQGRLRLLDGIIEDITERRRTEERMGQTLEKLRRFNRLAVDRERRMIELKAMVNEYAVRVGQEPPFDMGFVAAARRGSGEETTA